MADSSLTLFYEFARNKTLVASQGLGPTLDIVRADATGTVFNSEGLVETAAANVGRFDFDPANKASLGILIEELRANIGLHAEDTSNAVWVAVNMTKGSNAVITPRGVSSTTVRLTATAGNATLIQSVTSASANRAYAAFIKRATGSGNIQLTVDNGVTWTTVTVTSDWVRLPITQAAVTNPQIGVRIVTSGDAIDFFGSDIQVGDFITSYIQTVGSSVTRNADVVSTTDVSWFNANAGTFYVSASSPFFDSANRRVYSIDDGGTTDRIIFSNRGSDNKALFSTIHSSDTGSNLVSTNALVAGVNYKHAAAFADDDIAAFIDGVAAGTDSAAAFPLADAMTTFRVGHDSSGNRHVGHITELRYYNVHKDNQFLEDLSNGLISEDDLNFSRNLARPLERTLATTMR